jgi:hypothetical protein
MQTTSMIAAFSSDGAKAIHILNVLLAATAAILPECGVPELASWELQHPAERSKPCPSINHQQFLDIA